MRARTHTHTHTHTQPTHTPNTLGGQRNRKNQGYGECGRTRRGEWRERERGGGGGGGGRDGGREGRWWEREREVFDRKMRRKKSSRQLLT